MEKKLYKELPDILNVHTRKLKGLTNNRTV